MFPERISTMSGRKRKILILAGWLCIWQAVSFMCGNSILMVGPLETVGALIKNGLEPRFWQTVLASFARIMEGLMAGIVAGVLLAGVSYRCKIAEEIFQPVMTLVKAVPVASFTVLLLIWWGSAHLSTGICLLVVLPQIYVNTLAGLKNTDKRLLEMAKVYKLPAWNRFFYIYRPALRPFLESGLKIAIGLAWKSGVAAEVIGTPDFSIGERLYMSKIYLDTAGVLAWTAVTILLSVLTEKILGELLKKAWCYQPACRKPVSCQRKNSRQEKSRQESSPQESSHQENDGICLSARNLWKSYDREPVVQDFNREYRIGECCYYTTPSGSGKTTLFRLLAGLEQPDRGKISGSENVAMMFQEDRLCREYSAVKNVEMVTGDSRAAREALERLLPAEVLDQPVSQLSGGMCRRVALVRAMEAETCCCLLDEPYTGLDRENMCRAAEYIKEKGQDKALLIATHSRIEEN